MESLAGSSRTVLGSWQRYSPTSSTPPWCMLLFRLALKQQPSYQCPSGRTSAQFSAARTNLRRAVRQAKTPYKRKTEDHLSSNNIRQLWQEVQHMSSYKFAVTDGDALLAEELNIF